MKLYVEPMDVVVVEVDRDGRVRLETDEWIAPTLQEKRAILYAAEQELAALTELVDVIQARQDSSDSLKPRRHVT